MPKFRITETKPATYFWIFEVEAEDEAQALDKVMNGDVEASESYMEDNEWEDSNYEVDDLSEYV